jgi:DNA-binding NtrC family response regulator
MRKRRVIIIDDDIPVLEVLKFYFAAREYEVFTFERPAACPLHGWRMEACPEDRPCADIIITDYKMPIMNGAELLQRQTEIGCKVIVRNKAIISGYIPNEHREKLARLGYMFFQKPLDFGALTTWVEECEMRVDGSGPKE